MRARRWPRLGTLDPKALLVVGGLGTVLMTAFSTPHLREPRDLPPAISQAALPVTGYVTRLAGDVRAVVAKPAREGLTLREGVVVELGEGSPGVDLVCADGFRLYRLSVRDETRWNADPRSCASGVPSSPREVARLLHGPLREAARVGENLGRVGFWVQLISAPEGAAVVMEAAAQPQRLYPGGALFELAGSDAKLAIVCSTDSFVLLEGARRWTLEEAACERDGEPIAAGSFADLDPFGRLKSYGPSAELMVSEMPRGGAPEMPRGCTREVFVDPDALLEPRSPELVERLRPVNEEVPTRIRFVNGTCEAVTLGRIDRDGALRAEGGPLPSDGTRIVETYWTHPWLVYSESRGPIALYLPAGTEARPSFVRETRPS